MNLLYLTIGENINNHIQAQFSIYSFLTQGKQINTINVFTDQPVFYTNLKNYINIIETNENTLNNWKGKHNFFWRIKIKALETICNQYKNAPVIYLDTDTFLFDDFEPINNEIFSGTAFMHENEGGLSNAKSKTEKRMWRQVENRKFADILVLPSHCMWNAGVVATPNIKNGEECLLALKICDEMCEQNVTKRLIEQFALSVSLNHFYPLKPAADAIAHYWQNKLEWNCTIKDFFLSAHFKCCNHPQIIEAMLNFDFSKVAVKKSKKNTSRRLHTLVEKLLPSKNLLFVNNRLKENLNSKQA